MQGIENKNPTPALPVINLDGVAKSISSLADSAKELKTIKHEISIDKQTLGEMKVVGGYAAAMLMLVIFICMVVRKGGQK